MNTARRLLTQLKPLLAAPLLVSSMGASAALIELRYDGVVSQVSANANYGVGDRVSGSFLINTNLAPADYYSDSRLGYYLDSTGSNGNFISGTPFIGEGLYDSVYIENARYGSRDYLQVLDRDYHYDYVSQNNYRIRDNYAYIWAYDSQVDFIVDDSLNQSFALTGGSLEGMGGAFREYSYEYSNGAGTYAGSSTVNFQLSSLSMQPVAVPEPGPLALMALGLLGLAGRRRRNRPTSESMSGAACA